MEVTHHQAERDMQRLKFSREELVERINHIVCEDGEIQPLKGFYLARVSVPLEKFHSVLEPSLCVIAQGSKEVLLGNNRYQYDPFHYLLTTIELPRASQVLEASRDRPYLSLRLELEPQLVSSVMVEAGHFVPFRHTADIRAIDVSPLDAKLYWMLSCG